MVAASVSAVVARVEAIYPVAFTALLAAVEAAWEAVAASVLLAAAVTAEDVALVVSEVAVPIAAFQTSALDWCAVTAG
jgi:hypothetical protein